MGSDVGQIFPTASLHRDHSISYALVFEKNRIHHWCSVGTEKSQPEGPPFKWETRLAEFSTERWTQGVFFSGTTEHQWSILFLIYHDRTVQYLEIISWRFGYRPKYQPETPLSARELRLILRVITKTPCYNLFIIYSISLFQCVWRTKM